MRTTLSLDDDVAAAVTQCVRQSGRPFKQVINDLLRRGLSASARPPRARRFRVEPRSMTLAPGVSLDDIGALLELAEGSAHR